MHYKRSPLKSTSVSVCFRGISRLPSAFVFLRCFKLAHISIQVCTFHDGCKQGIDQQIFSSKSISRKITHPQSLIVLRQTPIDLLWWNFDKTILIEIPFATYFFPLHHLYKEQHIDQRVVSHHDYK